MTDAEKLEQIKKWMHPGLWSGLDGRRAAILSIMDGFKVEPPSWTVDPWVARQIAQDRQKTERPVQ